MQINTKECEFVSDLFDQKSLEFKKEMALHAINKYIWVTDPELNKIWYDDLPKAAEFFLNKDMFQYSFFKQDNFVVCACYGHHNSHPYVLGVSKCNVIDKFNLKIGLWLAFKRCIYNSMGFYSKTIGLYDFIKNCGRSFLYFNDDSNS